MVRSNISPETPFPDRLGSSDYPPGLVPLTLGPLLEKRVALKQRALSLPNWDPRRRKDKARSEAHKWLLVTCFGYLGYKNARFGRIEAHEAVTTWGREALLRAKEVAEEMGFQRAAHVCGRAVGARKTAAASRRIFSRCWKKWPRAPRCRWRWTACTAGWPFCLRAWMSACRCPTAISASSRTAAPRRAALTCAGATRRPGWPTRSARCCAAWRAPKPPMPCAGRSARRWIFCAGSLRDLRAGRVPLENLLVGKKLSKELAGYRVPSPGARAALQLLAAGKPTRPGQRIRLLFTRGEPGVHAWNLPSAPDPAALDFDYYEDLMLRAAADAAAALWGGGRRPARARARRPGRTACACPCMPGAARGSRRSTRRNSLKLAWLMPFQMKHRMRCNRIILLSRCGQGPHPT